jgi:putative transposase
MTNSPGFLRAPEGNGLAERFIGLLQENLLRVHSFAAGAELADALRDF